LLELLTRLVMKIAGRPESPLRPKPTVFAGFALLVVGAAISLFGAVALKNNSPSIPQTADVPQVTDMPRSPSVTDTTTAPTEQTTSPPATRDPFTPITAGPAPAGNLHVSTNLNEVRSGTTIMVSGAGFYPGEEVYLHLNWAGVQDQGV